MLNHKDKNEIMESMIKILSGPTDLNDSLIKEAKAKCGCQCKTCSNCSGYKGKGLPPDLDVPDCDDNHVKASYMGKLISIADELDEAGFIREANSIDRILYNIKGVSYEN